VISSQEDRLGHEEIPLNRQLKPPSLVYAIPGLTDVRGRSLL
jgi:hypothetical protein